MLAPFNYRSYHPHCHHPGPPTSFGTRARTVSNAQCPMPNAWDQRTEIVSKEHWLLTTQKIYSGQPKSHKHTLQQLIQIFFKHCTLKIKQVCWLKVAHQPPLNVPRLLGDLVRHWDFIHRLYTKMPHFYFWLTNSTPTQHLDLDASNSSQI